VKLASRSPSFGVCSLERTSPAEALLNSGNWGTKQLLAVKKCCICPVGGGKPATLKQ